jgi:hypothetical protein
MRLAKLNNSFLFEWKMQIKKCIHLQQHKVQMQHHAQTLSDGKNQYGFGNDRLETSGNFRAKAVC